MSQIAESEHNAVESDKVLPLEDTCMRHATKEDIPEIVRMGEDFCKALHEEYDEDSIAETALSLIENPDAVLLFEDGGMAAAMVIPAFLNYGVLNAAELFWWIDPEKRGNGSGLELLKGLEMWARSKGADRLSMIEMSGFEVGKLYEKHGFEKAETTFVKQL